MGRINVVQPAKILGILENIVRTNEQTVNQDGINPVRVYHPSYDLLDMFLDAKAAGSVNGTPAEPGPGTRVVTDTNSKLSIANGVASFATGGVGAGDPGLWYSSLSRILGQVILGSITMANQNADIGFDSNQGGVMLDSFRLGSAGLSARENGIAIVIGAASTNGTLYSIAIVLRTAGQFYFIKGGEFTNWTLVHKSLISNTAILFPGVGASGATSIFTAENIRIPSRLFIPVPLASDSFARADGALGVTDGLGQAEPGGGGLDWQFDAGAWAVVSNAAVGTPTQGAELLTNGNMETGDPPSNWTAATSTLDGVTDERTGGAGAQSLEIANAGANFGYARQAITTVAGQWHLTTAYEKDGTSVGLFRVGTTAGGNEILSRAVTNVSWTQFISSWRTSVTTTHIRIGNSLNTDLFASRWDDVSTKPLTLSSLFSSLALSTVNVQQECVIKTLVAGTQAGCVSRLNNAATPTSGIIWYWDGAGNIKGDEFTAAATWTNLLNVVKAYATGDKLVPWVNGSAWRLYHVTAAGVATLLGSGTTTVLTGFLYGNFSTYSGNEIESCNAYAVGGSENPYRDLDLV